MPPSPADLLAEQLLDAPARLADRRLVCLDGRSGAGKTRLAAELGHVLSAAGVEHRIVHLDDLYAGWGGLPGVARVVIDDLVEPWRHGRPARFARWDWHRDRRREPRLLDAADVVVLEGVGSYARPLDAALSLLVWVDCPTRIRRQRALARSGPVFAPHWDDWARDERQVHTREGTRNRADLEVDTTTLPGRVRPGGRLSRAT